MQTAEQLPLTDAELLELKYTFRPKAWAREVIQAHTDLVFDPWQLRYLSDIRKKIVLNCSRQSGKSTMTAVKALHMAIHTPKSMTLLVSSTLNQSTELFYRLKSILKDLGKDAPRTVVDNKTSLELVNGSRIKCAPDTDNIRGITADLVVLDEAAYINKAIMSVVSPMLLTTNGQLVVISTPAGKTGLFWDVYNDPLYSTYS
ncbi:MAG: terminase large subunit, partial [Clostridia bacterium]|nr:terminase large subunit [Clostridia bacterium]